MESAKEKNTSKPSFGFPVVGIGASAGGLEAIIELFDNIPSNLNASFIIVQHLSPDYKSMMPELLSKHTKMKIYEAQENLTILPNCIYVIPHKKNITLEGRKFKLTEKGLLKAPNMAIDIFFKSLAREKGDQAIGIILSGTGTDGTKGLEAIKAANGLTFVQDPLTAKFDGMPVSAINSGFADLVLSVENMADEIINFMSDSPRQYWPYAVTNEDEPLIVEILEMVKNKVGFDFTAYKKNTISRRIIKRMSLHNIAKLIDYKLVLHNDETELKLLSHDFLIGVTRFFRDEVAFQTLEHEIIPSLFKGKSEEDEIKIWVAACSSGEEAYSMGILVLEYMEKAEKNYNIKIFATDIDKRCIETAAKGYYTLAIEKDVSLDRLNRFFEKAPGGYKVKPQLRKMVVFAQHDLIKNAPYSRIDLVSCRNMLIYLNASLQKSIMSKFHFSLKVDGYLFLGTSENIGDLAPSFAEINKKWRIYQKTGINKTFDADSFTTLGSVNSFIGGKPFRAKDDSFRPGVPLGSSVFQSLADLVMMESGYSAVYIDENYNIVQACGDYKSFIRMPDQHFDLNITKMVSTDLSIVLGSALRKALKSNTRVSIDGVTLREDNMAKTIQVVVMPVDK
ncbi:MAG TPA: chemotaxis protein CheB, partial [Cytophagales bacterium]|nr:chemotaxis protein CheB [Cytophagales bacterium]